MPTITAIKPQKNQKRVNIYLDDKFSSKGGPASGWGFGLDLENYMKSGLKIGQELSEEEVKEIVRKAEFAKTHDKILRFGSIRPRSEYEYNIWLKKHKVPESLREELFAGLKRVDFLDDKRFAVWWVDQRGNFRPKPKRILNIELRIKGIKQEIIDEVLEESKVDESKIAKELLEKKKYLWDRLSDLDARKKMSEFLMRRGFNWDVVKKVVENSDEVDE